MKKTFVRPLLITVIASILTAQVLALQPSTTSNVSNQREIIVLVHGLMRSTMSMGPLKIYLEHRGYLVDSYNYPSMKYTIQEHGIRLNHYIKELLAQNPGTKINFVTHSLGGIIVREALSDLPPKQLNTIGSLIMLSPPNQGSVLAKWSTKMLPILTSTIKPLGELSSDPSAYVHYVPIPHIKMGIIAGRFGAKVPPSAAYLNGKTEIITVNSNHTFIMNNAKTKKLILQFLEKGTFNT